MKILTDRELIEKYWLPLDIARAYHDNLQLHISSVRECGMHLGVNKEQLDFHDMSKWSSEEFPAYATMFYGNPMCSPNLNRFHLAWLHHIHNNPHHPEYWELTGGAFRPGDSELEGNILQMPDNYVLEMVADWQGASLAYSKTTDMNDWLSKNLHKKRLHSRSRAYLNEILLNLGYSKETIFNI